MFSNVQTQDVSEFGSLEVCQNAEATPWCQPPKQKRKGHCSAWSSFWDSEGHGGGQQEPPTQHGVYKYIRSQNGNSCWNLCHGTLSKKERGGGNVETEIRAGVPSFSIQKPSQKCWMSCFHVSLQFTAGSPFYPGKKLNSTEKHTKADNFEELRAGYIFDGCGHFTSVWSHHQWVVVVAYMASKPWKLYKLYIQRGIHTLRQPSMSFQVFCISHLIQFPPFEPSFLVGHERHFLW